MNLHEFPSIWHTFRDKSLYFLAFFVFSGESYHILPELALGRCNSVSWSLHISFMFYCMVALFAKPRSKVFLRPYACPVPQCRFPWPDPENIGFTSVYARFRGVVFVDSPCQKRRVSVLRRFCTWANSVSHLSFAGRLHTGLNLAHMF